MQGLHKLYRLGATHAQETSLAAALSRGINSALRRGLPRGAGMNPFGHSAMCHSKGKKG